MRSSFPHLLAAGAMASGCLCSSLVLAQPAKADPTKTFFYGIANNNTIFQVNPLLNQQLSVNATGLGTLRGSNGIAYDTVRDQLFFFYNPTAQGQNQTYDLRFWNRNSTGPASLQTVATSTDPGSPLGSTNRIPTNAAYYNNAIWYFDGDETSTTLRKLALTYNGAGDTITGTSLTNYDLSNYNSPIYAPGIYGDVAITNSGILYGNTTNGNYYKINLNSLGDTNNSVYTDLGEIQTLDSAGTSFVGSGLQLSFNSDYTKLYGTRFCNVASECQGYNASALAGDGVYFEIPDYDNPNYNTTGTRQLGLSDVLYYGSPGFRDLGGAATVPVNEAVPGALPALGIATAFSWSRRLRRRISGASFPSR
jgi:hypothetical protein